MNKPGQVTYEAHVRALCGPSAIPDFNLCGARGKAAWAAGERAAAEKAWDEGATTAISSLPIEESYRDAVVARIYAANHYRLPATGQRRSLVAEEASAKESSPRMTTDKTDASKVSPIELKRGAHVLRLEVRSYATEHGEPATPADLRAAGYVPASRSTVGSRDGWAVAVLDAWLADESEQSFSRVWCCDSTDSVSLAESEPMSAEDLRRCGQPSGTTDAHRDFREATPAATRLAAAQAVYPTLPASVRAELGECPMGPVKLDGLTSRGEPGETEHEGRIAFSWSEILTQHGGQQPRPFRAFRLGYHTARRAIEGDPFTLSAINQAERDEERFSTGYKAGVEAEGRRLAELGECLEGEGRPFSAIVDRDNDPRGLIPLLDKCCEFPEEWEPEQVRMIHEALNDAFNLGQAKLTEQQAEHDLTKRELEAANECIRTEQVANRAHVEARKREQVERERVVTELEQCLTRVAEHEWRAAQLRQEVRQLTTALAAENARAAEAERQLRQSEEAINSYRSQRDRYKAAYDERHDEWCDVSRQLAAANARAERLDGALTELLGQPVRAEGWQAVKRPTATADEFTPEELSEMNTYPSPERVVQIREHLVELCRIHAPEAVTDAEKLLAEAKENVS